MKTTIFLLVLCGVAFAATPGRPPLPPHSDIVKRPIYCGPMFTDTGALDKATTLCVGRVLAAGRKATVGAYCIDGTTVEVLVWVTPEGTDMQDYNDVCPPLDGGEREPADMSVPPDMTARRKK